MTLRVELATGQPVELLVLTYFHEVPSRGGPEKAITLRGPFKFKVTEKRLTSIHPNLTRQLRRDEIEAGKPIASVMRGAYHLHVKEDQLKEAKAFIEAELERVMLDKIERHRQALEAAQRYREAVISDGCGFYDRRRPQEG